MTPHLRGHVRAYVDRALPPALLHVYDRHLICCRVCQAAAEQERRIVLSLRSHTDIPTGLRSSLMGLAGSPLAPTAAPESQPRSARRNLEVPVPPAGAGGLAHSLHDPVPTVHPAAPALHRSPVRAAVVASIAAGASVAAAWGLAVTPLPGTTTEPSALGPAEISSVGTAAFGVTSLVAAGFMVGSSPSFAPTSPENRPRTGRRVDATSSLASYWVVPNRSYDRPVVTAVRVPLLPSAQSLP